jgi:hypothetical protein
MACLQFADAMMCTYNLKGEKYTQSVFLFVHLFRDASNALLPNIKLTTALRALELNGALSHCAAPSRLYTESC